MHPSKHPSDIARETIKLIAQRRLLPTPDNYRSLYHEIAGLPREDWDYFPQARLQGIVDLMPAQVPVQKHLLQELRKAVQQKDWRAVQTVWVAYANLGLEDRVGTIPEPAREIVRAVASKEKKEEGLITPALAKEIGDLLAKMLPLLRRAEGGAQQAIVQEQAEETIAYFHQEQVLADEGVQYLRSLQTQVSQAVENQDGICQALLRLLSLGLENIAVLNIDDEWLHGQIQALQENIAQPLSLAKLQNLQSRLEIIISKQAQAKYQLLHAQSRMKELLATFIDRLAGMDDSSTLYQGQLEQYTQRVQSVQNLHELTPLLQEVISATRVMSQSNQQVRQELQTLRQRSNAAQAEITRLREELEHTSALARHDTLTGALNRTGFDEAIARATEHAALSDAPLCLALLDLDNFKSLNDRLGHDTGDRALQHLVQVTRQIMRDQDQLARYGGEEFVVLLPQTTLQEAVEVIRNLQRELTKRYFLEGNERILITFSAGVTQMLANESHHNALRRADQAMYKAKNTGKNQVVAA